MASVFQRDGGGGWVAKIKDERGQWVPRATGITDKAKALRLARAWEDEAREIREGRVDPRAKRFQTEALRPLAEHVGDFVAMMTGKGGTRKHVADARHHIERVIKATGAALPAELTAEAVRNAITAIRDGGKALRTCNAILRSVKTFAGWMEDEGRIRHDAVRAVKGFNDATDKRLTRRDLAEDELHRIIAAAQAGPVRFGMIGADRAIAYQLAAGTGFRRGELASLTKASFALEGDAPTVSVAAGYSKHRRDDVQPIDKGLAVTLAAWLKAKGATGPVLALPDETGAMLQADMLRARAAWICEAATAAKRRERLDDDFLCPVDGEGRVVDFHALRHHYISRVVSSGVSVKVAMELARHSTPTLTLGRYAHVRIADLRQGVPTVPTGKGPVTAEASAMILQATGTDDITPHLTGTENHAPLMHQEGCDVRTMCATGCDEAGSLRLVGGMEENPKNTGKNDTLRDNAKNWARKDSNLRRYKPADLQSATSIKKPRENASFADPCTISAPNDPEFAIVAAAWESLPAALKAGILAMVKAAAGG